MKFRLMTPEEVKASRDAPEETWRTQFEPNRCECGRYIKIGARCSLELKVYRDGTFLGWEHR